MRQTFIDIALTILFVLLQTTIAQYLAVAGLSPDIALIWIVYLALRRGQITGTIAGERRDARLLNADEFCCFCLRQSAILDD